MLIAIMKCTELFQNSILGVKVFSPLSRDNGLWIQVNIIWWRPMKDRHKQTKEENWR